MRRCVVVGHGCSSRVWPGTGVARGVPDARRARMPGVGQERTSSQVSGPVSKVGSGSSELRSSGTSTACCCSASSGTISQHRLVGRGQHHRRGDAVVERAGPVHRGDAPAVAGHQAREPYAGTAWTGRCRSSAGARGTPRSPPRRSCGCPGPPARCCSSRRGRSRSSGRCRTARGRRRGRCVPRGPSSPATGSRGQVPHPLAAARHREDRRLPRTREAAMRTTERRPPGPAHARRPGGRRGGDPQRVRGVDGARLPTSATAQRAGRGRPTRRRGPGRLLPRARGRGARPHRRHPGHRERPGVPGLGVVRHLPPGGVRGGRVHGPALGQHAGLATRTSRVSLHSGWNPSSASRPGW